MNRAIQRTSCLGSTRVVRLFDYCTSSHGSRYSEGIALLALTIICNKLLILLLIIYINIEKQKLLNKEYKTLEDAARDIRLIWTNCITYNQDGSEFYQLADSFARRFEEKYAEVFFH